MKITANNSELTGVLKLIQVLTKVDTSKLVTDLGTADFTGTTIKVKDTTVAIATVPSVAVQLEIDIL